MTSHPTDGRERTAARDVLVTGCSSGFGLLTAVELASRGWQVFATMRNLARRVRLDEIAADRGLQLEVGQLDVTDATSIDRAVSWVLEMTGDHLLGLVHNAGIGAAGFFEDVSDADFRRVMETNFFGVTRLTRAVLPTMRAQGAGRIAVVSSAGAFFVNPGLSAYGASKWAVEGWAEALSLEVRPFGIHVSLIEPGTYNTEIWNAPITNVATSPYGAWMRQMEPRVRGLVDRFGRDPQEVADRIAKVLEMPKPPLRNPVGPDAWLLRLSRLMPAAVRRVISERLTGPPAISPPRPD